MYRLFSAIFLKICKQKKKGVTVNSYKTRLVLLMKIDCKRNNKTKKEKEKETTKCNL